MKRVLIVAHQYWPTPGAATQRLTSLVQALAEQECAVHVVTHPPDELSPRTITGQHGEHIEMVGTPEVGGSGLLRVMHLARFAGQVLRLGWNLRFDIVITDPPPTAALASKLLAMKNRAELVYFFADSWGGATAHARTLFPRIAHRAVKSLEDRLLANCSLVVAVTPRLEATAKSAGTSRVLCVRNGVPLECFTPVGDAWNPLDSNMPFFVYAGNAGVVHGAEVFAEAAEALWNDGMDFGLVYMGYGADLPRIREIQGRFADRLRILPNQPPDRVAAAYRAALGALSSLRPFEAYADARPIKTLTGLACGCPPVYAGEGEFADLLRELHLGNVSEWSLSGAKRIMRDAMTESTSSPFLHEARRQRCAAFAVRELDIRRASRTIASEILTIGESKA